MWFATSNICPCGGCASLGNIKRSKWLCKEFRQTTLYVDFSDGHNWNDCRKDDGRWKVSSCCLIEIIQLILEDHDWLSFNIGARYSVVGFHAVCLLLVQRIIGGSSEIFRRLARLVIVATRSIHSPISSCKSCDEQLFPRSFFAFFQSSLFGIASEKQK